MFCAMMACTRWSAPWSAWANTCVRAASPVRLAEASSVPLWSAMSTLASIDRPTRSGCALSCSVSSAMRTGTRCTTLIQLPVAFCAGSRAEAAPVAMPRPATLPSYTTLLP